MFLLYDVIVIIFTLCYLPRFLLKRKFHRGFLTRVGFYPKEVIDASKTKRNIWLQAVSVGEMIASISLLDCLRREYAGHTLVISTTTPTGNQIARKRADKRDVVIYFPLDMRWVVNRAIDQINPTLFLMIETEIWPNMISQLSKKRIPIVLVNGRISAPSFRGYKRMRLLMKPILKKIDLFCMQTHTDASRILSLGAPADRVVVTGNMKFDVGTPAATAKSTDFRTLLRITDTEQLFVAGSTHRGEEETLLKVYRKLVEEYPRLRLLIAPRHIERTEEIERLIVTYQLESVRVSQLNRITTRYSILDTRKAFKNEHPESSIQRPVFILDTIGQLSSMYSVAALVFVGGSLVRHGGQNLIEPAFHAKPILFGPYCFNFQDIVEEFLMSHAAILVRNGEELEKASRRLLDHSDERGALGERAKEVAEKNRGATERTVKLIKGLLE